MLKTIGFDEIIDRFDNNSFRLGEYWIEEGVTIADQLRGQVLDDDEAATFFGIDEIKLKDEGKFEARYVYITYVKLKEATEFSEHALHNVARTVVDGVQRSIPVMGAERDFRSTYYLTHDSNKHELFFATMFRDKGYIQ